jgi:hypothetical protein
MVRFDGMPTHVEAPSFAAAVELWAAHMKADQGDDWDGDEQPEEVVLVDENSVVRSKP